MVEMQAKKEARRAVESKRASVKKDSRIIPQKEWERGSGLFALLMLLGWCAVVVMEVTQ